MKKILIVLVVAIIGLGVYYLFFRGAGGLKLEEVTTTKTANSTSISKSSTAKTPTAGLVLEKSNLKLTVIEVGENQVSFTIPIAKEGGLCTPGATTETYTIKKGEKTTIKDCQNPDKVYNISF